MIPQASTKLAPSTSQTKAPKSPMKSQFKKKRERKEKERGDELLMSKPQTLAPIHTLQNK